MKFVLTNDIHVEKEEPYKGVNRRMSSLSKQLLQSVIKEIRENIKPRFVANLGDLVGDIDNESDISNLKYVVKELEKCGAPVHHIIGNHDQRSMTYDDLKTALGYEELFYSLDYEDFHFVFLYVDDRREMQSETSSLEIPASHVKWLENDLKKTNKHTIIFSHQALGDQDVANNFWFSHRENRCLINNRFEVRKIIEESGKVVACINSHLHWNNITIHNNIPYITVQSMVENFNNDGLPSESYTVVDVTSDYFNLKVLGKDRMEFLKYL